MCCLFAHHLIPSFNLTGSSFCARVGVCERAHVCLPAPLFLSLCASLAYITAFSASVLHFRCAQKQRVFFFIDCLLCFSLSSLITSLTQSLLSLLDLWPEVTRHPAAPTETHTDKMKVLHQAAKANILFSPLLLFCPSICLPVLIAAHPPPLNFVSFSITLSRPLITVPVFSHIIFIYSLPPLSTHSCLQGRLALDVDLRRTDIQRPVPCLQH